MPKGLLPSYEASDRELSSAMLPGDIDSVAAAIVAYKGVVLGVNGTNPGWADLTNPRPPKPGELPWGHALYAVDFHIHADGQKCIICVTSWPSAGIVEHHLRADYFTSGNVFNPWTLIPKGNEPMPQIKSQAMGASRRIVLEAATEAEWASLSAVFGKDPSHVDETVRPA